MALRVLGLPPFLCKRLPKSVYPMFDAMLKKVGSKDVEVWASDIVGLHMITTTDDESLHLSISHPERYPTWNEILQARDWFFPDDMEVVLVLARKAEYVNLHPFCFHLWQSACGKEGR